MHCTAVWQHSSNSNNKIVHNPIEHFLCNLWFLFWLCHLLPVDCFHKLCLSGTPSENSQAGWNLGNRMARGYWFDEKWVCPWEVMPEVFKCSVWGGGSKWGAAWFLEHNTWIPQAYLPVGQTHFRSNQYPLAILFPRFQPVWLFSEGVPERQSLWKQSTGKRGRHQKRNQTDCTRNAQ